MGVVFPTIIPRQEQYRLHGKFLGSTEESVERNLKAWESVRPGERPACHLQSSIINWLHDQLQTCRHLSMEWIRENKPDLTETDIDRTERQLREIGNRFERWAVGHYEDESYLVNPSADEIRNAMRNIADTSETLTDAWIEDLLIHARERRTAGDSSRTPPVNPPPPRATGNPHPDPNDEEPQSRLRRLEQAKQRLDDSLAECITRLNAGAPTSISADLFGISIVAAEYAGILHFSVPPIEHAVIRRPEHHPLLNAHPDYDCVVVLRIHDPEGLTHTQFDLAANARRTDALPDPKPHVLPPITSGQLDQMKASLESWRRAVRRIRVEDVSVHADTPPRQLQSAQQLMFFLAIRQDNRLGSDELRRSERQCVFPPELLKIASQQERMYFDEFRLAAMFDCKAESKRGISKGEANIKARDFLKKHPAATLREVAKGIGCSEGLVPNLPAWKAVMEARRKGRKPKSPKVVALSDAVVARERKEDKALKRLIDEHQADEEPSPLDDVDQIVRIHKTL